MSQMIDKAFFEEHGYVIAKQLFSQDEAASLREHFMALRAEGAKEHDMEADTKIDGDPLKKFPRMLHMQRWDKRSLEWALNERITKNVQLILDDEPLLAQTMLYFKPPGARGQAMHQDQYYLRAKPGTCLAAWMALDDTDVENGCMHVVPGSHTWELLCPVKADSSQSFTDTAVPLPEGTKVVPIDMEAGDVLFFNGQLVHGSSPNVSSTRFRRSLIAHYIESKAEQIAAYDQPLTKMDGSPLYIDVSEGGGRCGVWVDKDGNPEIELSGDLTVAANAIH
jgi:phytanoyl-CoA hydroxylase